MIALLATIAGLSSVAAAQPSDESRVKPRIESLETRREGSSLLVSFRVAHGLTPQVQDRIHSGIPVTLRHRVEVVMPRGALWPSKTLTRVVIDTTATFDSLTEKYELARRVEVSRRSKKEPPLVLESAESTRSQTQMEAWMTEFDELPPLDLAGAKPGARLRVQVESQIGRRYFLFVIPTRHTVSFEHNLEP